MPTAIAVQITSAIVNKHYERKCYRQSPSTHFMPSLSQQPSHLWCVSCSAGVAHSQSDVASLLDLSSVRAEPSRPDRAAGRHATSGSASTTRLRAPRSGISDAYISLRWR